MPTPCLKTLKTQADELVSVINAMPLPHPPHMLHIRALALSVMDAVDAAFRSEMRSVHEELQEAKRARDEARQLQLLARKVELERMKQFMGVE